MKKITATLIYPLYHVEVEVENNATQQDITNALFIKGNKFLGEQNTTPIIKDRLLGGEELMPNMKLVSKNGKHTMVLQGDGNLVVYNDEDHARWQRHAFRSKNI